MSPLADPDKLPALCYVTDRRALSDAPSTFPSPPIAAALEPWLHHPFRPLLGNILATVAAGVTFIQIREKNLSAKDCALLYRATRNCIDRLASALPHSTPPNIRLVINDRLDVAIALQAAGVHLGEASLPVQQAKILQAHCAPQTAHPSAPSFLFGVSCHSLSSAIRAVEGGASYIFFGPIFSTPSKAAFGSPQGLQLLAQVCRAVPVPVFAIGGISLENAASCFQAGAHGLAAIRLFQSLNAAGNIAALFAFRS